MTKTSKASGTCLCGAVTISSPAVSHSAGACHCNMCRKWGGGPLMAVDCKALEIEGAEHVSVFDSSAWAERGFCSRCGTHLFYHLKQNDQYIVPAGLFSDDIPFGFDHQVFVDERPAWYEFSNETRDMTGPEIFAKYGA